MTPETSTIVHRQRFAIASLIVPVLVGLLVCSSPAAERPNIVLVMTDNHGAWTLGCYGNPDIRTPHIDRLADEGMLFTRAFSSNPVCSPTRATYLTGLLPSQHGVHCFLRRNEAQMGPNPYCTIKEFRTLPKVLSEQGYRCGLVGKWHLGGNMEPQEGFDDYWITMPHGGTSSFYDAEVIHNGELYHEPRYLTDLWTEHAVKFMNGATESTDRPFFLFLSYNGPYGLSNLLLRAARNRHYAYYADKLFPSFPRSQMHPWLFNNKAYLNNIVSIRRFAAELSAVDDGVGTVMQTLKDRGIDDNTLVVFCADQGWLGGQNGIWGMGDHTRPLTAFDGMMRVPLIFRHPGRIPAGVRNDAMVNNYDFMPTVLDHAAITGDTVLNANSPGRSYASILAGGDAIWTDPIYYEMENVRSIRTPDFKYVHRHPDGPFELYDLTDDPNEMVNLYGQPTTIEIQHQLAAQLTDFFARTADTKYDLYHGGGSKTRLLSNADALPMEP